MSSVFDANSAFPRSHSSSNIPDLINEDYEPSSTPRNEELPRSASFPHLPILDAPQYTSEKELQRGLSSDSLALPTTEKKKSENVSARELKAGKKLSKEDRPKVDRIGRRMSLVARPKSWIAKVKGGSPERNSTPEEPSLPAKEIPPVPTISKPPREKSKTVTDSFANFARKSWISTSRSPSPNRVQPKENEKVQQEEGPKSVGISSSPSSSNLAVPTLDKATHSNAGKVADSPTKRSGLLKKARPQSVLMSFTHTNSTNSSTSSLPRSSADNRSTPRTSTDKISPLPNPLEKLQSIVTEPRKKDELWSAFRSLDNDFSKFQSKTSALKTNVVRTTLLPFLRNHADHPSIKVLRPEDLDRRANILNKWWNGLLEMLEGRANQTVSGTDRPILLEAVTGIMMRPEWRLPPSPFAPLADHPLEEFEQPRRKSTSSSQFLIESVYHNIRIMFIQNLLSQMSLVVDKMSLRHAPASLVTFCGKATAYAFVFVPGVADVLVRIWQLPFEMLRRVADEFGLPRRVNKVDTDEVITNFPVHIHSLGWSSAKSLSTQLRHKPIPPLGASKIAWYGPWVARWCGRDSDLFFIFTKHYHILVEEFLSPELSLQEKARAPGFVLVHAQILTALDATIHRQPAAEPLPLTFDDVLAGADASATALPLPSSNVARLMAENRLIMLLRDFISERPSEYELARLTFAEAFAKMMQASAKRTSLFDHNACFVLCDFMEEALSLFVRFHHASGSESDFIDWYFWMDVCKKILDSQNSMSEIRLFALIFGVWGVITANERRKEILCLEWLLSDETFDKFFNHWCPMVRAYYMRVLCWRLCRDDGDSTDLDTKIFQLTSLRLKTNWAHYLYLKQTAEESSKLAPSTMPCLPAPGRRLLIIRNDNQAPSPIFLGFDGTLSVKPNSSPTPSRRNSVFGSNSLPKLDTSAISSDSKSIVDSPASSTSSKKRFSLFNKMLPSSLGAESSPGSPSTPGVAGQKQSSPPSSKAKTLEEARRETALARSTRPSLHSKSSSTDSESGVVTHRAFSFKFSLEWTNHLNSTALIQTALTHGAREPGRERRIIPPRLPAPAQAWLGSRVPGTSREVSAMNPEEYVEPDLSRWNSNSDLSRSQTENPLSKPYIGGGKGKTERAKYAGRALAEWALIVAECNNFVERRRAEGVPNLRLVEIPTLGIEGFRKFG
ncbi:DUF1765-domain-containing protein [Coleophoma crateriformis]|uniref:DUF1765-domain-containing protein n=1 Tax=Coleophoma crateriformis TaxID=565419 RepID=A0A3D8T756_9HELO|nr:DUF1765-domain-containing protein [Coleophoma crateriformis]